MSIDFFTVIISVWLVVLSGASVWLYLQLTHQKSAPKTLLSSLQLLLRENNLRQTEIKKLTKDLDLLNGQNLSNVQKVSFSRYNPFGEMGGEQSFTVVLLNGLNNGFLLTSLHTRSGTRTYAKKIVDGKSKLELSKEEQKALSQAIESNHA